MSDDLIVLENGDIRSSPNVFHKERAEYSGSRLFDLRKGLGYSRETVLKKLKKLNRDIKFSCTSLQYLEKDYSVSAEVRILYALSLVYDVDPKYFIKYSDVRMEKINLEQRLEKRKKAVSSLVQKASVMKRRDFEKAFINYDQEFIRRIYNMVETKLLKDAIDEL